MKAIPLTQGLSAMVDDIDYERLASLKWHAKRLPKPYAYHSGGKSMARMILDIPAGFVVDHVNGNTLDNRRENLRVCLPRENVVNRGKQRNHSGKYKGAHLFKEKYWTAKVYAEGRQIYLGSFKTEEEAALAFNEAARHYHGEFAYQNAIPPW